MIQKGDEQLYNELYDGSKKPKRFTFALYMHHFEADGEHYHMKNATLNFSTSDPHIGVAFINGISQTKQFHHPQYPFTILNKQLSDETTIKQSIVRFSILSGLLLESKEKIPLLITDETYEDELNIVMDKQFQALYGRPLKEPLKILGHRLKKHIIQETNRHAGEKILYYTVQKGDITLNGHPEDLQLIYQDGCGLRRSQGFGMLTLK